MTQLLVALEVWTGSKSCWNNKINLSMNRSRISWIDWTSQNPLDQHQQVKWSVSLILEFNQDFFSKLCELGSQVNCKIGFYEKN